jgi:hypothetical protein
MLWPAAGWKNPAVHSEQALAEKASENLPAAHLVQELAPGSLPVLATKPAAHAMQEATLETLEYSPAAHAVHVIAPVAEPVSVIEPDWQSAQ